MHAYASASLLLCFFTSLLRNLCCCDISVASPTFIASRDACPAIYFEYHSIYETWHVRTYSVVGVSNALGERRCGSMSRRNKWLTPGKSLVVNFYHKQIFVSCLSSFCQFHVEKKGPLQENNLPLHVFTSEHFRFVCRVRHLLCRIRS